jgi:hypothetical protein
VSNREQFLTYLRLYSEKRLDLVSAMFSDNITLRDWNISVSGKAAAVAETAKNFESAETIEIQTLGVYESDDTIAGELRILVDRTIELQVVDVITFNSAGKIASIRAYLGKGDDQLAPTFQATPELS